MVLLLSLSLLNWRDSADSFEVKRAEPGVRKSTGVMHVVAGKCETGDSITLPLDSSRAHTSAADDDDAFTGDCCGCGSGEKPSLCASVGAVFDGESTSGPEEDEDEAGG